MIASLTGYVLDVQASDPRVQQGLALASGETSTVNITVKHADNTTFDLTGGQLLLTAKRGSTLYLSRQATFVNAAQGTAYFPLVSGDTLSLLGGYYFDVWWTDQYGNRYQVVVPSLFSVTQADGTPASPVTVPPVQIPLAQGPSGTTLPAQGGHAGQFLKTDGVGLSWSAAGGGSPVLVDHVLPLSAITGDTIDVIGQGFTGLQPGSVLVGEKTAVFTVVSDTQLSVTIPSGALNGTVQVAETVYAGRLSVYDPTALEIDLTSAPPDPRVNKSATGVVKIYQVAALGKLIQAGGGQYHSAGSIDWTGRFKWKPGISDGYLAYCDVDATTFAIRTTNNALQMMPTFRGSDGAAVFVQGVEDGDEVEWRMFYDAQQFAESNVFVRINGVQQVYTNQGGPMGPALGTPTDFYIDSHNGASPFGTKQTFFRSLPQVHYPQPEFIFLGDSTTAGSTDVWTVTPGKLYTPEERWTRPGIFSFAGGGATIETQSTLWSQRASYIDISQAKAVILMVGINNLMNSGDSAAVAAGKLQTLINSVNAAKPAGCKTIVSYVVPNLTAGVVEYNNDIAGTGPNPITGVDAVCSSFYSRMFDATYGLKVDLQQGDNVHPNNAGRAIVARAWRATLKSLGLLP